MKFTIELTLNQSVELTVDAPDLKTAIDLAKGTRPDQQWKVESVNDRLLVGYDEGTDEPIFENDHYYTCDEGTMELKKNVDEDRIAEEGL